MKYILLCASWIIWCFLHSFLTSTGVTAWFKNRLGDRFTSYRIFYNLFSLVTVLPLFYWQHIISGPVVIKLSPFLLIFKYLALISGIVLTVGAFFSFDIREFFGVRQIMARRKIDERRGTREKDERMKDEGRRARGDGQKTMDEEKSQTKHTPVIKKHGFYGIVRHPMYLGGFVFFTALMTHARLAQFLGYLILAVYMIIGTFREDRRLARELGDIYRNYQEEVPLFLPKIPGN